MAKFPKVVVTGVGMVTPLALDAPSSWKALLAGVSGTGRISHFDPEAFEVKVAAEVKGFVAEDLMDRRTARPPGRHTHMAVVAANEAVASANLTIDDANRDAIGVLVASSGMLFAIGEQELVIEARGPSRLDPLPVPRLGPPSASARVLAPGSGILSASGEQELVIEPRGPSRVDPLTVPRVGQYSAAVRVGRLLE